jgi:hypothetical protein
MDPRPASQPRRRATAVLLGLGLLLARPAAADDDCPRYDVVADADGAEVVSKAELAGWAAKALGPRHQEGAGCFVFVAVISAKDASAVYASLRASRQGERVVLAETQSIATGGKAYRRRELRKTLEGFIADKVK